MILSKEGEYNRSGTCWKVVHPAKCKGPEGCRQDKGRQQQSIWESEKDERLQSLVNQPPEHRL